MAPIYPSADALWAILDTLAQQTHSDEKAAQRLAQTYRATSVDDSQSVDDLQREIDQQEQENQGHRHQLIAQLQAYEDRAGGAWAGPGVLSGFLESRILPDFSTPPSGDQVLCVYACVRVWKAQALGVALARDVLAYFWGMSSDISLSMNQRKHARDILERLLAPLLPPLNKGGLFSADLTSLWFLRAMLEDYERELAKIRPILRSTKDTTAILSALQRAYPDILLADLSRLVERAKTSHHTAKNRLRADRLTEALLARRYGSDSPDSIRKALHLASKDRKIQEALRSRRALS